jgi:hypothetical protein
MKATQAGTPRVPEQPGLAPSAVDGQRHSSDNSIDLAGTGRPVGRRPTSGDLRQILVRGELLSLLVVQFDSKICSIPSGGGHDCSLETSCFERQSSTLQSMRRARGETTSPAGASNGVRGRWPASSGAGRIRGVLRGRGRVAARRTCDRVPDEFATPEPTSNAAAARGECGVSPHGAITTAAGGSASSFHRSVSAVDGQPVAEPPETRRLLRVMGSHRGTRVR